LKRFLVALGWCIGGLLRLVAQGISAVSIGDVRTPGENFMDMEERYSEDRHGGYGYRRTHPPRY
jgi:hypothetical protein